MLEGTETDTKSGAGQCLMEGGEESLCMRRDVSGKTTEGFPK
jgi:hypothetical protein